MIEIIYNENEKGGSTITVKPPKNIRQIGIPRGRHKIYVEDYVYTFLHSSVFEGECQKRAAILLGRSEISQDIRYTFISGAVSCEDFVFQEDGILFDESCWEYIYKEIKQYFDEQEIVGWYLGLTGFPLELTPAVEAAHRKYFAGRDKVLFLSEPAEQEDVFFAYEQGVFQRKEGYYIYYEKNLSMQEYMVCTREKTRERSGGRKPRLGMETENVEETLAKTEEELLSLAEEQNVDTGWSVDGTESLSAADRAISDYRNMLLERREAPAKRKMSLLLYTAASAAMVILCVIGITTMDNYEKMKQVEETLAVLADTSGQEGLPGDFDSSEVIVESVPGGVTSQEGQQGEQKTPAGQPPEDKPSADKPSVDKPSTDQPQTDRPSTDQPQTDTPSTDQPQTGKPSTEQSSDGVSKGTEASAQAYLEQGYYIVQPGDRLERICKNIYQTTAMMDKLCAANDIEDVDKIYAGQKLVLP